MGKKIWNSEKIMSVSAILISMMTLGVLVHQTNLMKDSQRLSVMPYLYTSQAHTGAPNFKVILRNDGVGPALVESIKIKYDNKEYETDLPTFLRQHTDGLDSVNNLWYSNISKGMFIPAGKQIPMLEIDNSKEDAIKLLLLLRALRDKGLDMEITYQSIYGERWRLSKKTDVPEKLDDK